RGIRVNAVAPGVVDTDLWARNKTIPEAVASTTALTPLGRWASPEDVADVVAWLASDAARFVTAQTVSADGGMAHTTDLYGGDVQRLGASRTAARTPRSMPSRRRARRVESTESTESTELVELTRDDCAPPGTGGSLPPVRLSDLLATVDGWSQGRGSTRPRRSRTSTGPSATSCRRTCCSGSSSTPTPPCRPAREPRSRPTPRCARPGGSRRRSRAVPAPR